MTNTIDRLSLSDFIDAVIADRGPGKEQGTLSDEMCEAGHSIWEDTLDAVTQAVSLDVANSGYCSDLDLPQGSTFVECLAAALDGHPQFTGDDRLGKIQNLIYECGLREA